MGIIGRAPESSIEQAKAPPPRSRTAIVTELGGRQVLSFIHKERELMRATHLCPAVLRTTTGEVNVQITVDGRLVDHGVFELNSGLARIVPRKFKVRLTDKIGKPLEAIAATDFEIGDTVLIVVENDFYHRARERQLAGDPHILNVCPSPKQFN